jgi:O-antigen/teichoic acid export membrane protein
MAIPLEVLFVYSLFWAINPAAKTLIKSSSISKKEISLLIQQAKVQLPSAFMINTFMRIDVLLIRWWLGNETLAGIYGAAIRFSEPWLMIPLILSNSFSGKYFSLKQKDPEMAENYWKGVSGIILLVALFVIGFTWALAPLLQLYYGQSFAGLSSVMSVHIFIVLCSAAGSFGWPWLVAHNQHWQIFWRNLIGLIVMAGLSYLLWPFAGIVGIAIALVVSYAVNHIVFNVMVKACYPLLKMQLEAYQQLKISSIKATLKP